MSDKNTSELINTKNNISIKKNNLWWIILVCVIIIVIFNWIYIGQLGSNLSDNASDFEAYGSYIGGALGSILTFISIIVLVINLKTQNEANVKNIELLTAQLKEQKANNENSIRIFCDQLDEQKSNNLTNRSIMAQQLLDEKENNKANIALFTEQINQNKEHYDKTIKYNMIKEQVNYIVSIFNYNIDSNQFQEMLTKNEILSNIYPFYNYFNTLNDKFIPEYENLKKIMLITFLKDLWINKLAIDTIRVPHDLMRRIKNLTGAITNLIHLISQYFDHDISHSILFITIKDIFELNIILQEVGIYDKYHIIGTFEYFEAIKNEKFSAKKAKITTLNYRELKEHVFYSMIDENIDSISEKGLSYIEFSKIYLIENTLTSDRYKIIKKDTGSFVAYIDIFNNDTDTTNK